MSGPSVCWRLYLALGGNSSDSLDHTARCHAKDGPTSSSHFTMTKKSVPGCWLVSPSTLALLQATCSPDSILGAAEPIIPQGAAPPVPSSPETTTAPKLLKEKPREEVQDTHNSELSWTCVSHLAFVLFRFLPEKWVSRALLPCPYHMVRNAGFP